MAEETKSEKRYMKTRRVKESEINAVRDFFHRLEELLEEYDDTPDFDTHDITEKLLNHIRRIPRYDVVLFNLDTLLDNCADMAQHTLEFKPWITQQDELLQKMDGYLDYDPNNRIDPGDDFHQEIKTVLNLKQTDDE